MKLLTKRNQSGFTIIEVMIVLAIAGVIMLALFLAVPALQRNSRNNQRNSDAALIAASINECLNNRNGQMSSCNTIPLLTTAGVWDASKLRQLTDAPVVSTVVPGNGAVNVAHLAFGQRCTDDGAGPQGGAGSRSFAILYRLEAGGANANGVPRCLSS